MMKATCYYVLLLIALGTASFTSESEAADSFDVVLKVLNAETPIVISSNGEVRLTKVQAFDLTSDEALEEIVVNVSDPKLISNLEARIGAVVVGTYKLDGDDSASTDSTRLSISINSKLVAKARQESQELSLWVSPSELAAPDLKVNIGVHSATVNGQKMSIEKAPIEYRFGVLVRDSNWDGVNTYRIPALAQTNSGTLIAAYDARNNNAGDLPADIDVAYSRSFDGGKTWEPMRLALDFKGKDEAKEGVGDPAILVDPKTGRIWIAALWAHNGKSLAQSEPGLKLETSGQLVLTYSDDDGATWSKPRNITAEVASDKNWRVLFQGPGSGIVTRKGTLVFPAQFLDENKGFFSTIVWSDDQGETWRVGTGAKRSTCEAQVVELNDGSIMINMRNYNVKNYTRSVAITKDFGETWTQDEEMSKTLPCPICQASLIRVKSTIDGDDSNLLAFMNPSSPTGRINMTLKLSEDEGKTWNRALTLYQPGCYGYSSIVKINAETIGVLYETTGGLIYQTIKTEDVQKR